MPFIEDQIRRAVEQKEKTNFDWCVALESKIRSEIWVQLTWDCVNLYYPFADDPMIRLGSLDWPTESLELVSWEADLFLTLSFQSAESIPTVSAFVCRYLEIMLDHSTAWDAWQQDEYDLDS